MTTRRSGLSEQSRFIGNAFRMGTVIRVGIPEAKRDASMMISAIIKREDVEDDNLYALLTAHSLIPDIEKETRCELIRGPGQQRLHLGALLPAQDILGSGGEKLGFQVLRLEKTPLFGDLRSVAKTVATVSNFRKGIWTSGAFKVRRLNDPFGLETGGRGSRNAKVFMANRKGKVAGEIEDVMIPDRETVLEYSYCGLVTRGRSRPLGEPGALGAPVISRSGALSAIIVGAADKETLVYPVEELRRGRSIDFVTFGDDWPKVKIGSTKRKFERQS